MLLIRNGVLIDPASQREGEFDLLVDGSVIKDVGTRGSFDHASVENTVELNGHWIVPGLIDLHVHLREPGQEWKETILTGSRAAVLGGYTSVCCMPNTVPAIHSEEIVEYVLEKASKANLARVHPIGAVTIERAGKELAPLTELREAGCVAFSDDGDPVFNAGVMRRALEWAKSLDAVISCHEEDKSLSCCGSMNESPLSYQMGEVGFPKVAEEVMIARDIELARTTGARVHICHVSSGRGVELIRRAKNDGINITAEVTPHHLALTEDAILEFHTQAKMSPPLREELERELLFEGVLDGTIDCIASDHAPHENDSKELEFSEASMGILGLQTSLPLMLDFIQKQKISRLQAIMALACRPAQVFGLPYGTLCKGAQADITVIDPNYEWTYQVQDNVSKSVNSPFLNRKFTGRVEQVFVGGRSVVRDGVLSKESLNDR